MPMPSIASRIPPQAEREPSARKKVPFVLQILDPKTTLPQNTPQIGFSCYTISSAVRMVGSPIEGLEQMY